VQDEQDRLDKENKDSMQQLGGYPQTAAAGDNGGGAE
jgi:hypothetical protein